MLNNVSAERDRALNDLRRAGEGGGGGPGDGGDAAEEELQRLRRECDQLRDQVGFPFGLVWFGLDLLRFWFVLCSVMVWLGVFFCPPCPPIG